MGNKKITNVKSEPIVLDQVGLACHQAKLADYKKEYEMLGREKAEHFDRHDANVEIRNREHWLISQIRDIEYEISTAVKIERDDSLGDDVVEIGDIVTISRSINGEPIDNMVFLLATTLDAKVDGVDKTATLASVIGKAVYRKRVGESINYVDNRGVKYDAVIESRTNGFTKKLVARN